MVIQKNTDRNIQIGNKMKYKFAVISLVITVITGCSTLSKIADNGQPEGELIWPSIPKDITFDHDRGTYGDMSRIELIKEGATRENIYQLIGRPQFSEGFHVREWDYLFYFTNETGVEWACQYKILFDDKYIARNFYWKATSDETNQLCPPKQN